ncbi:hypothetical protein [Candidatus Cryosericum septentrionale]|jgi:hypothetical protein|nr:hypothetical protein [Candidatus Cryosericum septentrionale]
MDFKDEIHRFGAGAVQLRTRPRTAGQLEAAVQTYEAKTTEQRP